MRQREHRCLSYTERAHSSCEKINGRYAPDELAERVAVAVIAATKAWHAVLLAALAVGLYVMPYLNADDDLALVTLALWLGLPLLVGALTRSQGALAIPIGIGVLLLLTAVLGLGGDNEFWTDPFLVVTIVLMTAIEVGCALAGITLGRRLVNR